MIRICLFQLKLLCESMKCRQLHAAFVNAPKRTWSPYHSCVNEFKWLLDWSWHAFHQWGRESQMSRKRAKLAGSCLHRHGLQGTKYQLRSWLRDITHHLYFQTLPVVKKKPQTFSCQPTGFIPLWNVTIPPHATWYSRLLLPTSALYMAPTHTSLPHYSVFK